MGERRKRISSIGFTLFYGYTLIESGNAKLIVVTHSSDRNLPPRLCGIAVTRRPHLGVDHGIALWRDGRYTRSSIVSKAHGEFLATLLGWVVKVRLYISVDTSEVVRIVRERVYPRIGRRRSPS